LQRVDDALRLIKQHAPLHYSRILHNFQRILVDLVPGAGAEYRHSLNACVLDERFVLPETTALEEIASTIVHEATHARLEHWGIGYDEKKRARIEAICMRRELDFLSRLPNSESLQNEMARKLEWYAENDEWFSDANMQQHHRDGSVTTLRYLSVPEWLIGVLLKVVALRSAVRRFVRFTGRSSQPG
jgi:hypothetical protein